MTLSERWPFAILEPVYQKPADRLVSDITERIGGPDGEK
jgi:hypothetical protein